MHKLFSKLYLDRDYSYADCLVHVNACIATCLHECKLRMKLHR